MDGTSLRFIGEMHKLTFVQGFMWDVPLVLNQKRLVGGWLVGMEGGSLVNVSRTSANKNGDGGRGVSRDREIDFGARGKCHNMVAVL